MKTSLYLLAITLLFVTSCDTIHEFPNENPAYPDTVDLNVKVAFSVNDIQSVISETTSRSISADQCLRFVFEIYEYNNSELPVMRREITVAQTDPREVTLNETFALSVTQYYILVWADYLNKDKKADQFYSTQSLHQISFIEPFISDTDNRDCFVGMNEADLLSFRNNGNARAEVTITLQRPVARYALIANDVRKYISPMPDSRSDLQSSINNHTAIIHYPGYMPNSFNVRSSQPNDSRTGLWYASKCQLINDNEALICFDYPFVNGVKSQAKLNLQIYNEQGKLVNEIDDIVFPIKRDSLTVVRSDYFTRKYIPGISINPGYDGSFDITLPD